MWWSLLVPSRLTRRFKGDVGTSSVGTDAGVARSSLVGPPVSVCAPSLISQSTFRHMIAWLHGAAVWKRDSCRCCCKRSENMDIRNTNKKWNVFTFSIFWFFRALNCLKYSKNDVIVWQHTVLAVICIFFWSCLCYISG